MLPETGERMDTTTPLGEKRETWELGRELQDPWHEGLKGTMTTLLPRGTELCDCSYVTPGTLGLCAGVTQWPLTLEPPSCEIPSFPTLPISLKTEPWAGIHSQDNVYF